jgi:hypothetical protein
MCFSWLWSHILHHACSLPLQPSVLGEQLALLTTVSCLLKLDRRANRRILRPVAGCGTWIDAQECCTDRRKWHDPTSNMMFGTQALHALVFAIWSAFDPTTIGYAFRGWTSWLVSPGNWKTHDQQSNESLLMGNQHIHIRIFHESNFFQDNHTARCLSMRCRSDTAWSWLRYMVVIFTHLFSPCATMQGCAERGFLMILQ